MYSSQFGQAGTQFDFAALDPKKSREHLAQLETKFDSLRKKINAKVMNTLDRQVIRPLVDYYC
jgi:structural maintenance of chromosome 2